MTPEFISCYTSNLSGIFYSKKLGPARNVVTASSVGAVETNEEQMSSHVT